MSELNDRFAAELSPTEREMLGLDQRLHTGTASLDDCPAREGTPHIVSRDLSACGWPICAPMVSNRLLYKMGVFNDAHACKGEYSTAAALSGVILLNSHYN
jgi:hypothetical protein